MKGYKYLNAESLERIFKDEEHEVFYQKSN